MRHKVLKGDAGEHDLEENCPFGAGLAGSWPAGIVPDSSLKTIHIYICTGTYIEMIYRHMYKHMYIYIYIYTQVFLVYVYMDSIEHPKPDQGEQTRGEPTHGFLSLPP